jgi:hypothetical protein
MSVITTTLYNVGKAQSATTVQKTLKEEATTYYASVAIGNDGTGSLITADGASKGVIAVLSPANGLGSGEYTLLFPTQYQWLGAPAVACTNANQGDDSGAGQLYVGYSEKLPSVQLSSSFGIEVVGIGDTPVGVVRVITYQLSGSTEPAPTNLPSGSRIDITIAGTKSPVW